MRIENYTSLAFLLGFPVQLTYSFCLLIGGRFYQEHLSAIHRATSNRNSNNSLAQGLLSSADTSAHHLQAQAFLRFVKESDR